MGKPPEEWPLQKIQGKRQFVAYWHFNGFDNISFGLSINLHLPNLEIHLPFGFIRFGMQTYHTGYIGNWWDAMWKKLVFYKSFGKRLKTKYDSVTGKMKYGPKD